MKMGLPVLSLAVFLIVCTQSQAYNGHSRTSHHSSAGYCVTYPTCFPASTLSGTIQSVNYPNGYQSSASCSYSIEKKPGWGIHLQLEDLYTEASHDFLSINHYPTTRQGSVSGSGLVIAK